MICKRFPVVDRSWTGGYRQTECEQKVLALWLTVVGRVATGEGNMIAYKLTLWLTVVGRVATGPASRAETWTVLWLTVVGRVATGVGVIYQQQQPFLWLTVV